MIMKRVSAFLVVLLALGCSSGPKQQVDEVLHEAPTAQAPSKIDSPDVRSEGVQAREKRAVEVMEAEPQTVQEASFSRAELKRFVDKGPAYVLTLVEVSPERNDGVFEGFRIVNRSEKVESVIGERVRVGDVITHVNGVRLQMPDDLVNAWGAVRDASSIRVDFIRDGEPSHVSWSIIEN